MRKQFILTVLLTVATAFMAVTGTRAATVQSGLPQGALLRLADNHVMLRVGNTQSKYVLLPVQEAEEIAAITVIDGSNNTVQRMNVKLAVDRVDYWVPFELKNAQLLDIVFHGDRRLKGAIGDFVCWKEMKLADSFDTANTEKYRPLYHHTPQYGWMNDPNGMFYKDGVWHLYFQYNPYGSQWENMTWAHSSSKDLIHWEAQPTAIEPDALGDIFSGSAIVDKDNTAGFGAGAVIAMYTSAGKNQTQSIAYSTDGGRTFTKYAGNPVISYPTPDFRDPKVFWHEGTKRWIVVLAAGQEVQFYSSPNMKDWTYESSFGKEYGNHDGVWECPDLLCFGKDWVLLLNINPGGPFGGSATQYFTGSFDGHKFTCNSKPSTTKWMDYGKDHYATVTFSNAPGGRQVAMAWMSNWQYANQVPTKQFRSANSIPRDLNVFTDGGETYLASKPSPEMDALRKTSGAKKAKKPTEACEIVVDLKGSASIVLSNSKGEQVTMAYDEGQRTLTMDRKMSGLSDFSEAFAAETVGPTHGVIRQLRIFIDRSSIEVFDAEGKIVMTNLVFPTEPYNNIKVKGGKATIYEIKN